ncbi:hypothetical protein [Dapis sp. BLCC M229]|uniref:hypothetical protein n=1 Tax=Dapis sp. BLCC M229 TaxID=3400188 RepID=UPI003CF78A2A
MPEPFLVAITVVLGLTAAAVVIFWKQILIWAQDSLFPWINKNIPSIESEVREAFATADRFFGNIRNIIRQAWKKLRKYLLKQVVKFARQSSDKWIVQVTSWVIKNPENLESKESKKATKIVTEEEVDWDELPPDVRADFLRRDKSDVEIDVTEYRDRQIMEMSA